jgi:hypothetical protein
MKGPAVRRLSRAPVGQESGAQGVGTSTGREGKTFASGNVEASPTRPVLATEVTVDHNRNTTMKRGGKLETVNRFGHPEYAKVRKEGNANPGGRVLGLGS